MQAYQGSAASQLDALLRGARLSVARASSATTAALGKRLGQLWLARACVHAGHSMFLWFSRATCGGMHLAARARALSVHKRVHRVGYHTLIYSRCSEFSEHGACRLGGRTGLHSRPPIPDADGVSGKSEACALGGPAPRVVGGRAAPASAHRPRVARHIARVAEVRGAGECELSHTWALQAPPALNSQGLAQVCFVSLDMQRLSAGSITKHAEIWIRASGKV